MAGRGDVPQAVQSELLKLWPVAVSQIVPAIYNQVFQLITDGRAFVKLAAVQAAARFRQFGSGTPLPNRDPFQGGMVVVTPIMLGEKRSFQFQTIEEVQAAIGTDLKAACDNWAMAQENSRDLQAVGMLEDTTTTGYDGVTLFNSAHPQQSRYAAGSLYSNQNLVSVSLTHQAVRDHVAMMEDTNAVTESGDKMNCKATHLAVTGVAQYLELLPIIGSQQRAGTANNDLNALAQLGITPLLWRNLDQAQQCMYGFSNMPGAGGLIYVNKQSTVIKTQENFETQEIESIAFLQGMPAWTDWRRVNKTQLTPAQ